MTLTLDHALPVEPASDVHPRVLLTGARDWDLELLLYQKLDEVHAEYPGMLLVHGACPPRRTPDGGRVGADYFGDRWAQLHGVPVERHPADWRTHGKAAGPIRNRQMVDAGAVLCVAFLTPGCRGSRGTADMAERAGIPTRRIRPDGRERTGDAR